MIAGSTNRQGAGEWVGNLLWWGGLFSGIAALCITPVWATQEEQIALPSGAHRQAPRCGPHNPWLMKLRCLTECVGARLVKITRSLTELSREEGRRRTHVTER
jgi:hypothetical protein